MYSTGGQYADAVCENGGNRLTDIVYFEDGREGEKVSRAVAVCSVCAEKARKRGYGVMALAGEAKP